MTSLDKEQLCPLNEFKECTFTCGWFYEGCGISYIYDLKKSVESLEKTLFDLLGSYETGKALSGASAIGEIADSVKEGSNAICKIADSIKGKNQTTVYDYCEEMEV